MYLCLGCRGKCPSPFSPILPRRPLNPSPCTPSTTASSSFVFWLQRTEDKIRGLHVLISPSTPPASASSASGRGGRQHQGKETRDRVHAAHALQGILRNVCHAHAA